MQKNKKHNFTVLFRGINGITEVSNHSSLISAQREVAGINAGVKRGKKNAYAYITHKNPQLVRRLQVYA